MTNSAMASSDQCLKCHQNILDTAAAKMIVHQPISQNQCELCHDPTQADEIITESIEQDQWGTATNGEKWMEWLAESFVENTYQVATLPISVCDTELTVKLWYQNHKKQQSEIRCPDLNSIPIKLTPPPKPTFSQLRLDNYNDKLLSRATLSWTTAVPCRCQLLYRFDDHEYIKDEDDFYTLNHNQEIRNFNPTNTDIAIQCDDTFQQHTQSDFIPLSTLTPKTDKPIVDLLPQETTEFSTEFKRIADFIEISITTNQPAAISIGRIEQKKETLPVVGQIQGQNEPTINVASNHPPLSNEKQINTTICFKCHRSTVENASHPINVLPPPGMVIPVEYPLLSNGKLTCMTCHNRHSSNNEARLIKKGKKELCTGCHTNY